MLRITRHSLKRKFQTKYPQLKFLASKRRNQSDMMYGEELSTEMLLKEWEDEVQALRDIDEAVQKRMSLSKETMDGFKITHMSLCCSLKHFTV